MSATSEDVLCSECKEVVNIDVEKFVFCANKKCMKYYHKKCSKITDADYKKYSKDKHKVWFCKKCVREQSEIVWRRSIPSSSKADTHKEVVTSSESPVQAAETITVHADVHVVSKEKSINDDVTKPKKVPIQQSDSVVINNIHTMVKEMNSRQNRMEAELAGIKHSFESRLAHLENELTYFRNGFEDMRKELHEVTDENQNLKKTVENVQLKLNQFEQDNLSCNVEICGVHEETGENLGNVLFQIKEAVGCVNLIPADMKIVYRKNMKNNTSGLPRPIVVKFINRNVKLDFMKKCKTIGNKLSTNLIYRNKPNRPIYINHQLTGITSYLLMNTKREIKNGLFKFVWVQDGKILTRRVDHGPIQQIYSLNHLNGIISRN